MAARTVINKLEKLQRAHGMTLTSLDSFFINEVPEIIEDLKVSVVGAFRNSDGIRLFYYDALRITVPGFQDMLIAGSGTDAFARLLSTLPLTNELIRGDPNNFSNAFSKALVLTGLLLSLEIGTRENLLSFYGGGYELASLIGGRFAKIDDVTYVFWSAEVRSESVQLNSPHAFLKYAYRDDALLIRSLHPKPNSNSGTAALAHGLHIFPKVGSAPRKWSKNDLPSMESKFLCNYVIVENPPHPLEVLCHVDFELTGSRLAKFNLTEEEPTVSFQEGFINFLGQSIYAHIKENS